MTNKVLVVVAHADDETLGCGGTIARHITEGDDVHIAFMTDGVGARNERDKDDIRHRVNSRDKALKTLGVENWHALDFPDNRMDSVPLLDIVQALEAIVDEIKPVRVYTHHSGDLNIDHRITHQAVLTACRPLPQSTVKEILTFEVMSSTEWADGHALPFVPQYFVNISDYLETKVQALKAYETEMREPPHSRSYAHLALLAEHRGHSTGVRAAEAFMVVRMQW